MRFPNEYLALKSLLKRSENKQFTLLLFTCFNRKQIIDAPKMCLRKKTISPKHVWTI